jgi:endonuclease YncB( thermonuclease family)
VRALIVVAALTAAAPIRAADVTVVDGDTIKIDGTTYRLDGIDAPEKDQTCLDEKGDVWPCGAKATERLMQLAAKGAVTCEDKGPASGFGKRRVGICSIEGESINLNHSLVSEGWAINFEPYAKGRFTRDEADARDNRRGIWKGCFAAPRDFRRWNRNTATLLGPTCPIVGKDLEEIKKLFPETSNPPSGCRIKGKIGITAQLTGYRGIYHLKGCSSYQRLKNPNRWFCSEEEARAAGFRKALTCR